MKSFAVAALVSMVAANPGLLDSVLGDNGLKADVKLPAGIEISADLGPKSPPPAGRTNTWHPAHPGVDMDGCDANDDGWHYVHPCDDCQHGHHTWTTSTATGVVTKTVIDCAPTVTNCPARTTAVTTVTTTICPVTNTNTNTGTATATVTPTVVVPVTTTEVPVTTESPCPPGSTFVQTTQGPPAVSMPPTNGGGNNNMPPANGGGNNNMPPANGGNNTMTQPPVIVNGGAQAQVGIFAAVAAIAALL